MRVHCRVDRSEFIREALDFFLEIFSKPVDLSEFIREALDFFLGIFSKPVDPPPLGTFRNKNVNFVLSE